MVMLGSRVKCDFCRIFTSCVSQIYFSTAMLRIRRISGEELTTAPEQDLLPDVRALKHHLHQRQDLPPRFRQRLFLHGQCLEDTATLSSDMELEVVVLAFIPNPSTDRVQEFTAAAGAGDFDKVRASNGAQFRRPHINVVNRSCRFDGLMLGKSHYPQCSPAFRLSPC